MAKLLYVGTYGSNDPTKAGLVFRAANGATRAGHEPVVALMGEGVLLMKDDIAASTAGVGLPSVKELIATAVANGTAIHRWGT